MSIGGGSHGSRAYGPSPTWDRLFGEISRGFDLVGLRPARLRIVSTVVGRAATLLWREMQGHSKTFRWTSYVGVAVLKKAIVLPTSFELVVRAHRYRFRNRACASSSQTHRVICAQRTAFIQDTLWSPRRRPTCEIGNPPIFPDRYTAQALSYRGPEFPGQHPALSKENVSPRSRNNPNCFGYELPAGIRTCWQIPY